MRYALWTLDLSNPAQITGPESEIKRLGGVASSSWANGEVQNGATILGYVSGIFETDTLSAWNYRAIEQSEALAFAQSINPSAYLLDNGLIGQPRPD